MARQNATPLYATLLYDVRKALDVSVAEYMYLDMVHKLSYDRWCSKSLEHCGDDIGITKRGMLKMRDRLIERGLLKKNVVGHLKVTPKYTEVAVNKVHQPTVEAVNLVPRPVNLVPKRGEQSSPKNNNRVTENSKGHDFAASVAARLRRCTA